jgi:hypothetical protein
MNSVFCTGCNFSGEPFEVRQYGSTIAGVILVLLGLFFLTLLSAVWGIALLLIGGIGLLHGYLSRSYCCPSCGSPDLIPGSSPRAKEFRDRSAAFEHIQKRIPIARPVSELDER